MSLTVMDSKMHVAKCVRPQNLIERRESRLIGMIAPRVWETSRRYRIPAQGKARAAIRHTRSARRARYGGLEWGSNAESFCLVAVFRARPSLVLIFDRQRDDVSEGPARRNRTFETTKGISSQQV